MMFKSANEEGQSTVEFIMTFALGVSVVLFIFKSALNYSTGYLIHYATFMASRTFLTSELYLGNYSNQEAAISRGEEDAKLVFAAYDLGIFDIENLQFKINRPHLGQNSGEYIAVGGYTIFDAKMDMVGQVAGQKKLEMVSESFLGKEPVRTECASRTCFAITGNMECDNATLDITLFDDGC